MAHLRPMSGVPDFRTYHGDQFIRQSNFPQTDRTVLSALDTEFETERKVDDYHRLYHQLSTPSLFVDELTIYNQGRDSG